MVATEVVPKSQSRRVIDPRWVKAARLAAVIDGHPVTQEDVAKILDVGFGTVSKRERGVTPVNQETWFALLSALGHSRSWEPTAAQLAALDDDE